MVCSGGHDEENGKSGLDFLVNQGCEAIVVHASRLPDKERCATQPTFQRWLLRIVIMPVWPTTGVSG